MPVIRTLSGKKFLFGITGSIAAYKSIEILRELVNAGADVQVVMTSCARRFAPPITLQVFSKHPVYSDLFEAKDEILHLSLAQGADLILVAPATAHFIARAALGLADDLLTSLLLGTRAPLLLAPAMDGEMWSQPAVQRNVALLRKRGACLVGPVSGPLASGRSGPGRMAEPSEVLDAVLSLLHPVTADLADEVVLVTAGPTQEPIDPVRFLSNRSSGKMGYAVAQRARARGAKVILVSGPTALCPPAGVEYHEIRTAQQMQEEIIKRISGATVLVMAAAVSDFRPEAPSPRKIKKGATEQMMLELVKTEDILEKIKGVRAKTLVVGFAAETEGLAENARQKLVRKGLDLIVANEISQDGVPFGSDDNEVTLFNRDGLLEKIARTSKLHIADRILDVVERSRRK